MSGTPVHPGRFDRIPVADPAGGDPFNRAIRRWERRAGILLHKLVYPVAGWPCCTSSGCAPAERSGRGLVYAVIVALLLVAVAPFHDEERQGPSVRRLVLAIN